MTNNFGFIPGTPVNKNRNDDFGFIPERVNSKNDFEFVPEQHNTYHAGAIKYLPNGEVDTEDYKRNLDKNYNIPQNEILTRLQRKFDLTEEQARTYLKEAE